MSEELPILHIRIRELRRERSLTQEELAAALGLSRQSINAMEAGRNLPSLPVALQLASYFSVPLQQIFQVAEDVERERLRLEASERALVPWHGGVLGPRSFSGTYPAVNLYGDEDGMVVAEIAVPGFAQDELHVEVGEDFLAITGEPDEEALPRYERQEFQIRAFERTVSLPIPVVPNQADASLRDGILQIRMQPQAAEKPKTATIEIRLRD